MADGLSSPDPLSNSQIFYSPRKSQRTTRSRQSLPAQGSSPTKQRFELDVGNRLSPQKLIVTVETESEAGNPGTRGRGSHPSPSRRPLSIKERTVTTVIPVKGLSDSEDETQEAATPKRGRGRPRKSAIPAVGAKKDRNSTPRSRISIGDLVDGDDDNDLDFQIGKYVEVGRGKGKSRSRSTKGTSRQSTPAPETTETDDALSTATTTPNKRPRGRPRRKSLLGDNVLVRDDAEGRNNDEESTTRPQRSGALQPIRSNIESPANSRASSTTDLGQTELEVTGRSNHGDGFDKDLEVDPEEVSELGEMREFDTILESEEFSMISVDSVPSLLQQLSSPVIHENISNPTNQTIKSLQEAKTLEDSFSSIPEEVFTAATPARKTRAQNLLSLPATIDDSFSSVPRAILEAATPGRKSHLSNLQTSKFVDNHFSGFSPEIVKEPTTDVQGAEERAVIPGRNKTRTNNGLPPAIQAAVSRATVPGYHSMDVHKSGQVMMETSNISQPGRSVSVSNSATDRLPTPEETPSPGDSSSRQLRKPADVSMIAASRQGMEANSANQPSLMHSYMPSSPPLVAPRRYTYTAHLRRQSQLHLDITQTPSIVFSSPALPPPINIQRDHAALNSGSKDDQRPALSPVARAGQALQSIIVPSSPRPRSLSLRSPFKSPAADRKPSIALGFLPSPSKERGIKHLPRLDLNSNLSATSQNTARTQSVQQDDPFNYSGAVQPRSPSPEENDRPYRLELPKKLGLSDKRIPSTKSATISSHVLSEDAMSWQPEEELSIPEGNSSVARMQLSAEAMEQKWADERAAVRKQIATAEPNQVIVIDSDVEEADYRTTGEEEDDLGLLLETINSSSQPPSPQEQRNPFTEKPRRSKIPSPWRKNSKRLVYSDELSNFSSPMGPAEASTPTGFSMAYGPQPAITHPETPLFSDDEIDSTNIPKCQIPQKSNFKPRARETGGLDLSALFSPVKPLPVLSKKTQQTSIQNVPTSSSALADEEAPVEKEKTKEPRLTTTAQTLFSQPLKALLFQSDLEARTKFPSEERSPLVLKKPQALNRLQRPEEKTLSSLNSEDSIVEKENISTHPENRTLKWAQSLHLATKIIQTPLPDRTASPIKSCFRTPASPSKNVAFVSSSPEYPPSQEEELLSGTEWSKKHWLLLEGILHAHQAALKAEISSSSDDVKLVKKRRNSTRVVSKLLGRRLTFGEDEMFLEQWHLEVIDEFRGKVPGWEEKIIALRMGSLIVVAEKRRLGLIK